MEKTQSIEENFEDNKHYYYITYMIQSLGEDTLYFAENIIEDDLVFIRYINIFFRLISEGRSANIITLKLDYNLNKIIRTENLDEDSIEQLFIIRQIALIILNSRNETHDYDNMVTDVQEIMRTYIDSVTCNNIFSISQSIDHESYDEFKKVYNEYFNI